MNQLLIAFKDLSKPGNREYSDVHGQQIGLRKGTGYDNEFLGYQISDGAPQSKSFDLFIPYRVQTQTFVICFH